MQTTEHFPDPTEKTQTSRKNKYVQTNKHSEYEFTIKWELIHYDHVCEPLSTNAQHLKIPCTRDFCGLAMTSFSIKLLFAC